MSRIGKKPITVPSGVTLTQSAKRFSVKRTRKESFPFVLPDALSGEFKDNEMTITGAEGVKMQALCGAMARTNGVNMIEGVTTVSPKLFELRALVYRAPGCVQSTGLTMQLVTATISITHPQPHYDEGAKKPNIRDCLWDQTAKVGQVVLPKSATSASPSLIGAKVFASLGDYVRQKEGKRSNGVPLHSSMKRRAHVCGRRLQKAFAGASAPNLCIAQTKNIFRSAQSTMRAAVTVASASTLEDKSQKAFPTLRRGTHWQISC